MSITKISTVSVGAGGVASIDFNSIPGTMTDLLILLSVRGSVSAQSDEMLLTFNGSTSGYSYKQMYGSGSSPGSGGNGSAAFIAGLWQNLNTSTTSAFGSSSIYIPNYSGSTTKSITAENVSETNATGAYSSISTGFWTGTSAITSLSLKFGSGTIQQYSSATLYGVTKGSLAGVTVS